MRPNRWTAHSVRELLIFAGPQAYTVSSAVCHACAVLMSARFLPLVLFVVGIGGTALPQAAFGQESFSKTIWEGKVHFGDNPKWAHPSYDDSDWPSRRLAPAPDTQGVHWVRVPVTVDVASPDGPMGLYASVLAAAEVYWDGVRIDQNGRVAHSAAREVPGTIRHLAHVPDSLYTPGDHLVALRLSNHYMPQDFEYYLYSLELGPYRAFQERSRSDLLPLLFLGAFVLVMLYCGALYALDRRRAIGIFGLLCGAVALLLVLESARGLVGYTYDWHPVRIDGITALTAAIGLLLPWFFVEQFGVGRRRLVLGGVGAGLVLAIAVPDAADPKAYWMYWVMMAASFGITGWAARQRKRGAWMVLFGVAVCIGALIAFGRQFAYRYFFPTFAIIVAGVLATLARRARERERRRQKAELAAKRREAQLLKKQLQPHFLMNTLTAAIEWLETEPDVGVQFVEALAQELRLLSNISDQPAIPLRRELSLCRLHLEVMGYRQNRTFRLHTDDLDGDAHVPPAIVHTLLENALTHNCYTEGTVTFSLHEQSVDGGRRYRLHVPLGTDGASPESGENGTGLRYVKARLREQYGTDWTVRSGSTTNASGEPVWVTLIDIYDADEHAQ